MRAFAVGGRFVEPGARGDVHLAPDDRLHADGAGGFVKIDGAVHHAVVGDGAGGLAQIGGALRQLLDPARAVQQAVLTVNV